MTHQHWSSYWQSGISGSFGINEPEWYTHVIKPYWKNLFDELARNSSILDIATGNGAVAFIASDCNRDKDSNFSICATDKARHELSPDSISSSSSEQQDIQFQFGTAIENLNFPDHSFDVVTSQFGIEYADTNKALRVLKPFLTKHAELVFIIHHKNSVISQQSRDELKQYRIILEQTPVFKKLKTLLISMGDIKSTNDLEKLKLNSKANKDREAFNRVVSKLTTKNPHSIVIADCLNIIKPLFKEKMMVPVKEKLRITESVKLQMSQARLRLLDMIEAAFDDSKLKKFIRYAESSGYQCITAKELTDQSDNLLAWEIRLRLKS